MTTPRDKDQAEELGRPEDQTIGFVDSNEQFDAVMQSLKAAGYADASIVAMRGDEGIEMLKQLQETFNFGDGEDAFVESAIKELKAGHCALRIKAEDRESAVQAASLAEPLGAHSFSYFGTWVNERLTR